MQMNRMMPHGPAVPCAWPVNGLCSDHPLNQWRPHLASIDLRVSRHIAAANVLTKRDGIESEDAQEQRIPAGSDRVKCACVAAGSSSGGMLQACTEFTIQQEQRCMRIDM